MRGSGINEVLGQIFGPNVIVHILSGRAITRALHVLFLLYTSLTTEFLEQIIPKKQNRNMPMRQSSMEGVLTKEWSQI